MSIFLAHIREAEDGTIQTQTVEAHSKATAEYAGQRLSVIDLDKPAYLAGMLHDMGKYKQEFQKYLTESIGEKGSVIHTFAGARFLLDACRKRHEDDPYGDDAEDIMAELVSYAIAAHHGLFDISESEKEVGFTHRKNKKNIGYEECFENYFKECIDRLSIEQLIREATEQIGGVLEKICNIPDESAEDFDSEVLFYMGVLERLLLSALVDGDRIDTATFMNNKEYCFKDSTDWHSCLEHVEHKLNGFPNNKPIDIARGKISDECKKFAEKPGGIYKLNVPTGAGKTLASLRFALAHADKWNKSRIIFTAPLLTILEQNAAVLRSFIQNDSLILEHHSNVIRERSKEECADNYELLTSNWDSPIVITSMVQLLNTMFDGKTSSVRRFHSLVNSIIVIDEVQTLPTKLLSLFNLTMNFLAKICNTTIILCSATQPNLNEIEHPLLKNCEDMVPYDEKIWSIFKRTDVIDCGKYQLNEVPEFAKRILDNSESLLIVCNKKTEAEEIYRCMKSDDFNVFHLSASMCTEHRRSVLRDIFQSLEQNDKKTVCVSTQVIEAGVDISFGVVIRLAAGMDSIVQSAGRCNRHAEIEGTAPVYILQIIDEDLKMLGDIKRCKDATIDLLNQYKESADAFSGDLTSAEAISYYYQKLYGGLANGATEFQTKEGAIFDLLGMNIRNRDSSSHYYMQQSFKTAGKEFTVFEDNSIDVIVPYKEGYNLICDLTSIDGRYEHEKMKELIEKAKNYTVSVFEFQKQSIEQEDGLHWICDGAVAVLDECYYNPETGLTMERKAMKFQEV